jgi:hypothetical protein
LEERGSISNWDRDLLKLATHLHLVPRLRIRGATPPTSPYVFMASYLVKGRDNFTLLQEGLEPTVPAFQNSRIYISLELNIMRSYGLW